MTRWAKSKEGILYNGMWFAKDQKTGYYLNSAKRKRLHRYVWECHHGAIPRGYDIHHKDFNKDNNGIENLVMLTKSEHHLLHAKALTDERIIAMRKNMEEKARPAAILWHRSNEGRKWHKKHAQDFKFYDLRFDRVCEVCGKKFKGLKHQKFCSNICRSKYRRSQGFDNVVVTCCICGKKLKRNKYSLRGRKEFACHGHCAGILRGRTIKARERA